MKKNSKMLHKQSGLNKVKAFDLFLVLIFFGAILITLYPFLNVLAISFNDAMDTFRGVNFIIPRVFTLENYRYLFKEENLGMPLLMSIARTVVGAVTGVLSTAMIAYVLSRKDFYFKKLFTVIFIITMYVSGGMVPEYLLISRTVKLTDNFLVYIIPGLIWVYNVILVRSYIEGLPEAIQETARIDGANDLIIWYKIVLPLCKPVLATVALFVAVGQWNSFMDTYLYARKLKTLQYVLYDVLNNTDINQNRIHDTDLVQRVASTTPQSIRMAITVIATVPIVIVYPFVQKYFIGGMTLGAVKD